ncbi:MAG TPA: dTDP-4-dehydrorhamnose reductase [Solirubrobacterales bacterium]|nr:dTDP-4-dehydrorhamnose reductase [Solirubrobacterales bacterium]
MKVLVTGAGGMLGADVVRAAGEVGHDVVACTRADLDITDPDAVRDRLERDRPGVVINCAAWTDVDGAEADETGATRLNAEAAGMLAAATAEAGAEIVQVSTDYVFDGSKKGPYLESDPTAPVSAYGRSKLAGEVAVAAANRRHFIVRTAWLYGHGGSNFVETMLRLASDHGEVLVVYDQVGSPTSTQDLARGLVRLIEGAAYGLHHMAAAGSCSWFEFAREIFDQAGVECRVLSATTEMLGRPAPRPANSVLESERPHAITLPDWHQGLAEHLARRQP